MYICSYLGRCIISQQGFTSLLVEYAVNMYKHETQTIQNDTCLY